MYTTILFLMMIILCATKTVAQEYTTDANTVLLLHFNETNGSTVSDASGNNNNGTATGTTIVDGKFGKARRFNGTSDYVTIPHSSTLIPANAITIEGWFLFNSFSQVMNLIDKRESNDLPQASYVLWYENSFDIIYFNLSVAGTKLEITFNRSSAQMITGLWYHIAGTYDGSVMRLYLNGVQKASLVTSGGTITPNNGALVLGRKSFQSYYYFDGKIDEVRISNIARQPWEFNYPVVKSVTPTQNALNISKSSNISATFNVSMNPATLNTNNILVYGTQSGKHTGTITLQGDTAFTFNPTTDFKAGEVVNVTLTKNILSAGGDSLTNGYHWKFTTATTASTGTFGANVDYVAGGSTPYSVYVSDLDGDTDGDIVVTNVNPINTVSIFKNNGDGTFQTKVDYSTGTTPAELFIYDLDGDGDGDLVTANHLAHTVSILKNNGDGTFQTKVDYPAGSGSASVFVYDLDGDGDGDLAIPNYFANTISILKNNGNGTFQSKVDYSCGSNPSLVFISDLDNDGDGDLVVSNQGTNTISVFKNNGDGTFQAKIDYTVGSNPFKVFVSDLDGDGDGDIVATNQTSNTVSILKNNGDGTFAAKVDYATGSYPASVFVSDLDGDGDGDLVVANFNSNTLSVLKNNGDGTFQSKVDYAGATNPRTVFVADLDGDGDGDLAVANFGSNTVSILKNINAPSFSVSPSSVSFGTISIGANKTDSVTVSNSGSGTLSISDVTSSNAQFTVSPTSATVNANSSQKFTITFTPTSSGATNGDIIFAHNATGSPDTVTVNGTGAQLTITATSGSNGTISPSDTVKINYGADTTFTFSANTGYHVDSVIVDGLFVGSFVSYLFPNVTANHTIRAVFAIYTFTISATASGSGSISPSGNVVVNYGTSIKFTNTPNSSCYKVDSVIVDGVFVDSLVSYTFNNVTTNHSIRSVFKIKQYTITATAGNNGSIFPSGSVTVDCGGEQRFCFTPNTGYRVSNILLDGEFSTDSTLCYTFNNVIASKTIHVTFTILTYTITATTEGNGVISPSGTMSVNYGSNKQFCFSPAAGYYVDSVIVDGVLVDSLDCYTFENVTAIHTIKVKFSQFGSISGMKFNDANGNGTKDNGENGLANWKILLSGNATDSQRTNANGNYVFSNLPAGTYTVSEVFQNGWTQTLPSSGSYTVNVSAGENVTGKDFGNYQDTMKFRTFKADTSLDNKKKIIKLVYDKKTGKLKTQPNVYTAIEHIFFKRKKNNEKEMMMLGILSDKKKYAWLAPFKKATDFNALYAQEHYSTPSAANPKVAYPLDYYRDIISGDVKKKMVGSTKAERKKINNVAVEQGVVFRLNIIASATDTITPAGFGSLVFDTSFVFAGRQIQDMTLHEGSKLLDTIMTYWDTNNIDMSDDYANLYNFAMLLKTINNGFYADLDTTNYSIVVNEVVIEKNPYAIYLKGIKTASEAGIVKYVPGKPMEEFLFSTYQQTKPSGITLLQNYPNPFNPLTTIHYTLSTSALVSLKVYNVLGQEVAELIHSRLMDEGDYEIEFDANGLTSGVYFYRLSVSQDGIVRYTETKKLLLMK